MKLLIALATSLLLVSNVNAYNILIDFEDSPLTGDLVPVVEPIESQGFNFSGLPQKGVTSWPLGAVDDGNRKYKRP